METRTEKFRKKQEPQIEKTQKKREPQNEEPQKKQRYKKKELHELVLTHPHPGNGVGQAVDHSTTYEYGRL